MNETECDKGLLVTGARVYTADPASPWAEAVLTRGNRIVYVGSEAGARAEAGSRAEEIHVPGGLAVPGLNDSHVHMTLASYGLHILNLDGVATLPELQERLRDYAVAHPERPWVEGYGLVYEVLDGLDRPARLTLDEAVADRPVYLLAFDWHTSWANTEALRRAGIDRGADIPRPNEVVVDAMGLATGHAQGGLAQQRVTRLIDEPTPGQRDDMLCKAMRHLNRLGITSVQNMDGDPERLEQYERLRERGDLSVRAYHYMSVREHPAARRHSTSSRASLTCRRTTPIPGTARAGSSCSSTAWSRARPPCCSNPMPMAPATPASPIWTP